MPPSSKSNRENAQQRPASIPSAPSNHPPGERERVATLSHPATRGGCRGAERPTPASSETASTKGQPASSGTKISARTTPGERERAAALSNFQSKGFPQEIVSFSPRGWRAVRPGGGGACSPVRMRQASSQMRRALLIPTPVAYRPSSSPSNSIAMSPS